MPATSSVEAEVLRIRELLERNQFGAALSAGEVLAASVPENRDVLYMIAVSQRYLKKIPEALATLDQLERHHPKFSRLFQERGHCYVTMRNAPQAIDAFLRAVNLNSALPASWRTLETLYRMTGQAENAGTAAAHVATLAKLPSEIVTATGMFSDGEFVPAEAIVRAYLLEHGNHVEAMRLLARIGLEHEVLDDAETLLEAVLALAPDYQAARYDYSMALLRRHKHVQAIAELEKLLELDPSNRVYRTTYATAKVGLGDHERALGLYRDLVSDAPQAVQTSELHLSVAHSLKALGRQQEAIESYRTAAAVRPSYGDAYWSLANLKTYRFPDDEISRMRAEEASATIAPFDRYHLCFALGKALEDLGEFEESFRYYERGNALKKSMSRYRPEPVERNTRLQAAICTREFFAAHQRVGSPDPSPIFVVGLPRSGSTLLEQILSSHSAVEGTMELPDIGFIPRGFADAYPEALGALNGAALAALGDGYVEATAVHRKLARPFFIDKMPNNFLHIGLIQLILPRARIIDARRHPLGSGFSAFKQHFAKGQAFSYDLADLGGYYRDYVELMAHFDAVLPGRIHRLIYEDLIEDTEREVARLLDYCGLPFEEACLKFYENDRAVRTVSSEQVRRPIFRGGLDQWRAYEPWLGPLKEALGPALEGWRGARTDS